MATISARFRPLFRHARAALIRLLEGKATGRDWCDDSTTPERESCGAMLAAALNRALADLEMRYGKDREHGAGGGALCLQRTPSVRRRGIAGQILQHRGAKPGGNYTLNRGKIDFDQDPPFANRHASSYRAIYDFATWSARSTSTPPASRATRCRPYYRSFAARWAKVGYIEIATKREDIAKAPLGTWKLTPK